MADKRKALESIFDKFSKFLPLLASDKEGEADNARRMINRELTKAGLDWHDVLTLLSQQKDPVLEMLHRLLEKDTDALVRFGLEGATFFSDGREVFADVMIEGHRVTCSLASNEFTDWLLYRFYSERKKAPATSALKNATRTLAAHTRFKGGRHGVQLRVAQYDRKVYVDIGDPDWHVIEIDMEDWRVIRDPPVRFRRTPDMAPLPLPERGGSIDQLRPYVNLNDAQFVLYTGGLVDALYPAPRPHPLIYFIGLDGSGKTVAAKIARSLTDPTILKLRGLPGTRRDFFVCARAQHLLVFDNVSKISWAMSEALCQVTSGTGFGIRKLFTDMEEVTIGGSRGVMMTGINNAVTAPDLASRTVPIPMQQLKQYKEEEEFWPEFERARPQIFGGLLDCVARGLRRLPDVKLSDKPRMADFAVWATACESAPGAFMTALEASAVEAAETVIEHEPVADAVCAYMTERDQWQGTAAELLTELTHHDHTERCVSQQRDWPRDPAIFGRRLRQATTPLRRAGIEAHVERASSRKRTRSIKLRRVASTSPTAPDSPTASLGTQRVPDPLVLRTALSMISRSSRFGWLTLVSPLGFEPRTP
jgi:hypothetical protein